MDILDIEISIGISLSILGLILDIFFSEKLEKFTKNSPKIGDK